MNRNYKRNLLIGFGVSLLILMITSAASFVSIRSLLGSAERVRHTNEVIFQLDKIEAGLRDAEAAQRGYLLTKDIEFLTPFESAKKVTRESQIAVKRMTVDNDDQQLSSEELRKLINQRIRVIDRVIEIHDSSKVISTADLQHGKDITDSIQLTIEIMKSREQQLLLERTERMNIFSNYTPVLIVIGAIIALIITISFYARVSSDFEEKARLQGELQEKDRVITQRIDIIRGIADKISTGNFEVRVSDDQSDALGNVAGSLNKMALSLQTSFEQLSDNEWLQTGINQLSDVIIGEKPLTKLCQDILEFIATYTNSQAGAFYILDHDNLVVQAGYAYKPAKSKTVKLGEGFIGQAVTSGKVMELKEIPEESIIISFTTAHAKPKHIVAVPLYDGYTIKGGIEIASLSNFAERDILFLKAIGRNIAIAISITQNRKKLQELLEETQSQSEELQAQHGELENMNSELEVQAEKLQASEEELKVQQEELKQSNGELEERSRLLEERNQVITERNFEIQAKAKELELSTKYKSEFLANMSHELRTPLNSILLLSRLMGENTEKNLSSDQVEYARVIQSSGQGLLSLIDEILDLSKIESGKMELEYLPVSMHDLAEEMQSLFNPLAQDKGIEFKVKIDDNVPGKIETDKLRLEQIVRNLLSNAIKFTATGYVSFTVKRSVQYRDHLDITVKDTGIGIPEEKQKLVFEAFQQADGSTRRKYGGTGLGLSISRELVKLLGGEIELQSVVGEGSEFTLHLPMQKLSYAKRTPIEEAVDEPGEKVSAREKIPGKYISSEIPASIPDDRSKIKSGDKVMLIVEDDVNFAKSLLDFTRKNGYKGVVAVRGDEGLELAHQLLPVGILLDIQLPVMSGWEVMDELKANPDTRHIPVHIMSSYEVKSESLTRGAVDFVNKPLALEQMQGIFEKIEYVLTHNPKKVLIVEENTKHARALAYFLETYDIALEVKTDVDDAVKSLKQDNIDCVILDMGIPDQKSYDTLEEVKKIPGLENLPIIIFTGKSLSKTEEQRIKKYADSIVIKTAHSYKRILDEVSLFLHLVENKDKKEDTHPKYNKLGALDEVLKNKTVLIADDDMRNIFSLTKALENYKMNVITAVDGKDALSQLRSNQKVDIVLMDMMMPEMDGYESTRAIRKDRKLKNIPVIAVTAKAMMGDRDKCINAGASDYITKPVDIDQLLSLLRVWLYESGTRK